MVGAKDSLKKILLAFGLKVTKGLKFVPLLKHNVFKTDYQKKVLISYLTDPFIRKNDLSHTNLLECYTAAEIFNELGFGVDAVDYFADKKIDYSQYEVIYGMGQILEKSFYFDRHPLKRIFYATGCNPVYSNIETLLRVRDFFERHGKCLLNSSRFLAGGFYLQTFLSDSVIVLGNDFVLNTYRKYDQPGASRFTNLSAFFYDVYNIDLSKKDFFQAQKHFLWFGSSGLLHKGLDLLLDFFSEHSDIFLHICGAPVQEKGFFQYYSPLLEKSKNIINHGFIDIRSEEFRKIMDECAFVVSPSVSEGGSPAVLNTMANGGLIPIVTRSSGLDIDNFGIIIENSEMSAVEAAINQALLLDGRQLLAMATTAKDTVRHNYTYSQYKKNLKRLIKDILGYEKNI